MDKDIVLSNFINDNPLLVALRPRIAVEEILESFDTLNDEHIVYRVPELELVIKHPFVFDNLLVPKDYQGIKVKNLVIGKFPKEFNEVSDNLRLEEYHNPKRYIRFVERRLLLIRKKLNRPTMSAEEALDALTNGFQEHVEWCRSLALLS